MKRKFFLLATLTCLFRGFTAPFRYQENVRKQQDNNQNSEPEANQASAFFKQLTNSSSLRFHDLSLTLTKGGESSFSLTSNDLAVSYLEGESKSFSGHRRRKTGGLSLPFGLFLNDKNAALEYDGKIYTRSASSIGDIVGVLTDSDLLSSPSFSSSTVNDAFDQINAVFDQIAKSVDSATDTISSLDGSHVFTFTTDYGNVERGASDKLRFTSLSTPKGLTFKGSDGTDYVLTLNGKGEQSLITSYVSPFDSSLEKVDRDGLDPLFVTFLNRAKKKTFAATLAFDRKGKDGEKGFDLKVNADLSSSERVQAKISQGQAANPYIKGEASVYYEKETTYINVNNQSKGHLTNQKVKDVFSSLSLASSSSDTTSLIENVASLLSSCAFKEVLQGDYSHLTDLVSSVTSSGDGTNIKVSLSAKAFGLSDDPDKIVTITLSRGKDEENNENEIKSIQVEGIPFKEEEASLTFTLDSFTPSFDSIDTEEYKTSYNGILPVRKQITPYLETKQFGRDLSVNLIEQGYTNEDGSYKQIDFGGEARFDLTKEDAPEMALGRKIKAENKTHDLDVRYLGGNAYRTLGSIRKQSISKTEASSVFSALSEGIAKLTKADEDVSSARQNVLEKFSSIFTLSDGLDLSVLSQFVLVSSSSDDDHLILELDPSIIDSSFKKGGTLTLRLTDKGLASLSLLGLKYQDIVLNVTRKRKEYVSPSSRTYLDGSKSFSVNDFKGKEVNSFSFFVTGLFDLLPGNEKQFTLGLNRSIKDRSTDGSYPLSRDGTVDFDYLNSQYAGDIHLDRDKYTYDPSVRFYYSKNRTPYNSIEDNLAVKYYHQDNKGQAKDTSFIGALRGNKSIQDRTDQISTRKKTNLFYAYLGPIVQIYNRVREKKEEGTNVGSSPTPDFVSFLSLLDDVVFVGITDGKIHLELNNALFGSSNSGIRDINRTYQTVNPDDWKITSIDFSTLLTTAGENEDGSTSTSQKEIKGSLSLTSSKGDFTKYSVVFNDDFKKNAIDFNSLPVRTSLLLSTTDQNDFSLSGSLKVNLHLKLDISLAEIDAKVTAAVHVEKGTDGNKADVSAYILVECNGTKTEYYIRPKDADCFIVKHYANETKLWLVTQKERTSHIGYYLCALGFNFEEKQSGIGRTAWKSYLVEKLENSGSSSSSDEDKGGIGGSGITPEKLVKSRTYSEKDKKFNRTLDLSSINLGTSLVSFTNSLPVEVKYKTDDSGVNKLSELSLKQDGVINILDGLAKADVEFNASLNANTISFLPSLNKVQNYYYSKTGNKDDYYVLTEVDRKGNTFLEIGTYWIEASGTGTLLTIKDNTTLPPVV